MSEIQNSKKLLNFYREHRELAEADRITELLEKKGIKLSTSFDQLRLDWNPDGTLDRLTFLANNEVIDELLLIWNGDGTLDRIVRR